MTDLIADVDVAFPAKQREGGTEGEVERVQSTTNSDSGSLTQRAARIKDELLGNDLLEQHTVHAHDSSSGSSSDRVDQSDEKAEYIDDNEELEERLSSSSIAHSLRHIALAFDEKIQQTHQKELASLRAEIETKENDRRTLLTQLEESTSSHTSLQRQIEALRLEIEHKDELLCFSDRIASRLFNMINNIRAEVEAAELLSPALRSLSTTPATSSCIDATATSCSEEGKIAVTSDSISLPLEELIKEIEAKYSD
ncbi:uncharacterized protein UTRI_04253_B [Ustilago trichophora]|uniref:Uncharacterized protein n=1 Tax=Ustilago trichophora TaxID=86804 RepID=A0A5C3EDK2_9BASI|nr:uncharacterized protein UTRI_04253_B [Ustilago trichophora]